MIKNIDFVKANYTEQINALNEFNKDVLVSQDNLENSIEDDSTKIYGKKIYLRPLSPEDAEGNYPSWLNDKEVCRYNSHGSTLYTKEMAAEYIENVQSNSTYKVFAICLNANNQHIGNISLQNIKFNIEAEFAILMGEKKFWGKGYAKEAGEILIDYGFNQLELKKIYCGTSEANIPMQKEKQTLLKDNKQYDIFKYEIKRSE